MQVAPIELCPVASVGGKLRIVVTDRTCGVKLYSCTDSLLVSEAIVRSRELDTCIDGEVVV